MRTGAVLLLAWLSWAPLDGLASLALHCPEPPKQGIASWYSESDAAIQKYTASGEVFDDTQDTCASWEFAFGTYLKVTNVKNGRSVVCRVNDRGPAFSLNRRIDLTKTSFEKIADPNLGLIEVRILPQ